MAASPVESPKRATYRHGDLYRALLDAGVELARSGGPDAVVLREVTRRVGVAPNAAYRHFADHQALLGAVCAVAQSALAVAMETEQDAVSAEDPVTRARGRLRAVGSAYLSFAQREPGLFRTAFSVPGDLRYAEHPRAAGESGRTAYQLLGAALDDMVEAGALPMGRRPGAEVAAWAAVHGLAMLLIDGPLRALDAPSVDYVTQQLLDMVKRGLTI
jgi:AcrR family transcriptional regulator